MYGNSVNFQLLVLGSALLLGATMYVVATYLLPLVAAPLATEKLLGMAVLACGLGAIAPGYVLYKRRLSSWWRLFATVTIGSAVFMPVPNAVGGPLRFLAFIVAAIVVVELTYALMRVRQLSLTTFAAYCVLLLVLLATTSAVVVHYRVSQARATAHNKGL